MYLWLSLDDLRWAHDAQSIPDSVLGADDDATWRQFRGSQQQPDNDGAAVTNSPTSKAIEDRSGFTRSSSLQTATWTQVRDAYNNDGGDDRKTRRHHHHRHLQQPDGNYGFHTPWEELPFSWQIAAAQLGYDKSSWVNGGPSFTDGISWANLGEEQQDAAIQLGYSQYLWDSLHGFQQPATTAQASSPNSSNMAGQLSTENSSNAGFGSMADGTGVTTTTMESTTSNSIISDSATAPPNGSWRNVAWENLPNQIKGGALSLGYTEQLWNSGAPIATGTYFWHELNGLQQRAAAAIFGYTGKLKVLTGFNGFNGFMPSFVSFLRSLSFDSWMF